MVFPIHGKRDLLLKDRIFCSPSQFKMKVTDIVNICVGVLCLFFFFAYMPESFFGRNMKKISATCHQKTHCITLCIFDALIAPDKRGYPHNIFLISP